MKTFQFDFESGSAVSIAGRTLPGETRSRSTSRRNTQGAATSPVMRRALLMKKVRESMVREDLKSLVYILFVTLTPVKIFIYVFRKIGQRNEDIPSVKADNINFGRC